jgi:hypothetical protein
MLTVIGNGMVPLAAEEIKALDLVDKVSWVNNEAFDDADGYVQHRSRRTADPHIYRKAIPGHEGPREGHGPSRQCGRGRNRGNPASQKAVIESIGLPFNRVRWLPAMLRQIS